MKNNWINLYKNLLNYKKIFNKKEEKIKEKYDELRLELDKKEKEELQKISNLVEKQANKENYDIFCGYYEIDRQIGFEIGKKIRIKLKDNVKLSERDQEYKKITEDLVFTLKIADYREGLYMYHCFVEGELEDKTYYIDTLSIIEYFDVIEVIKKFQPYDYTEKEMYQHNKKGKISEEVLKTPTKK